MTVRNKHYKDASIQQAVSHDNVGGWVLEIEVVTGEEEGMRRFNRAFDPTDALNSGKLFPETPEAGRVWFADR